MRVYTEMTDLVRIVLYGFSGSARPLPKVPKGTDSPLAAGARYSSSTGKKTSKIKSVNVRLETLLHSNRRWLGVNS